jgi:hypothetical protein
VSDALSKDDLLLLEKLALLLSHKATLAHGDPWNALLAEHGFTEESFLRAYGRVTRRFISEPTLAEAYATLYQEQTAQRFREAAEAKGLDVDPRLAGSLWNVVHDIDAAKAAGFAQQYIAATGEAPEAGYAPNLEAIARAADDPSAENIARLLADTATVFHVDWREEPLDIIGICAHRLPSDTLRLAELNVHGALLASGERNLRVELTGTRADREAILRACASVLQPAYEIRVCVDSLHSDTLSFVCLRHEDWNDLERAHGTRLHDRFAPLAGRALFD